MLLLSPLQNFPRTPEGQANSRRSKTGSKERLMECARHPVVLLSVLLSLLQRSAPTKKKLLQKPLRVVLRSLLPGVECWPH